MWQLQRKFRATLCNYVLDMPQRCPTYQLQNAESGDTELLKTGWAGKFQEIRVSVEVPQKTLVRGTLEIPFVDPFFFDFGSFSWGDEKGQS